MSEGLKDEQEGGGCQRKEHQIPKVRQKLDVSEVQRGGQSDWRSGNKSPGHCRSQEGVGVIFSVAGSHCQQRNDMPDSCFREQGQFGRAKAEEGRRI